MVGLSGDVGVKYLFEFQHINDSTIPGIIARSPCSVLDIAKMRPQKCGGGEEAGGRAQSPINKTTHKSYGLGYGHQWDVCDTSANARTWRIGVLHGQANLLC
jgi:hypothetical protein